MPRKSIYAAAALLAVLIWVLQPVPAHSQTHSYRIYDEYTGLPGSYLNVIEQDRSGFLWVGIDTGLYRYDGFAFHNVPVTDTMPHGNPSALYCDNTGTMWVGMSDGSLFVWNTGGNIMRKELPDTDKINRITEGPDKKIWIVTQTRGIYLAEPGGGEKISRMRMPEEMTIFDIAFAGTDKFLVATQDNLHLCAPQGDGAVSEYSFPELEYTWVQTVVRMDDDTWFAGTGDRGLYMIRRTGGSLAATPVSDTALMNMNVPALTAAPGRTLIIGTLDAGAMRAVFSTDFSEMKITGAYNISTGLPENNVRTLFRDREENLWIGLFSSGLAGVTTNAFSFHRPVSDREITFIGRTGDRIVAGTRNGLYDFNQATGLFSDFRNISVRTGGSGIASWAADDKGNTWIGTVRDGIWVMNGEGALRQFYLSRNPGQNHINSVAVEGDNVWLGTSDGVVLLDRESGSQKAVYTTLDMLPHNYISQVVVNRAGDVLVATKTDRLCYIHVTGGVRTEGQVMEGTRVNEIRSLSVGAD
ncbi:MAG: two-component regulator propeller domain-containing protein, partial [Bacteroidales bacterium]|nr:two-component regulator propeller domain-containing protein [Bacteroidales bacterium]